MTISRSLIIRLALTANHASPAQIRANQAVSFLVRAPRPSRTPRAIKRGSVSLPRPGARAIRVISRHPARTMAVNGIVESGSAELSTSGRYMAAVSPVPIATTRARPVFRPRSSARSAARIQARTGTRAPTRTDETCAAAKVGPSSAIGMAARNDGNGNQTSNAGWGMARSGVWKLHSASVTRPRPSTRLRATPK